ncbi:MAG: hypothetical protein GX638_18335 [Crenarchaeota archaeon]|nr:hypothetical protein [Thermoproteota archaeon]
MPTASPLRFLCGGRSSDTFGIQCSGGTTPGDSTREQRASWPYVATLSNTWSRKCRGQRIEKRATISTSGRRLPLGRG